jgi:DNA ligase-4
MNKGAFDIIRPQWLFDSIANKEVVPMSKKYFFHATAERMESEEYNNETDDLELEDNPLEKTTLRLSASPSIHTDGDASESKEEDSEMQQWLQIGPSSNAAGNASDDDVESVTDPDSGEEDNWFSVEAPQPGGTEGEKMEVILCMRLRGIGYSLSNSSLTLASTSMNKLMQRRPVKLKWVKTRPWNTTKRIFSGTCMLRPMTRDALYDVFDSHFYLDTPHNARNNGMSATSKHEVAITKRFVGAHLPKIFAKDIV